MTATHPSRVISIGSDAEKVGNVRDLVALAGLLPVQGGGQHERFAEPGTKPGRLRRRGGHVHGGGSFWKEA